MLVFGTWWSDGIVEIRKAMLLKCTVKFYLECREDVTNMIQIDSRRTKSNLFLLVVSVFYY